MLRYLLFQGELEGMTHVHKAVSSSIKLLEYALIGIFLL